MRSSCVICTDLFDDSDDIVSIPCGHVFHSKCLLHWLDQSKTCPECRRRVMHTSVSKLFFNTTLNYDTSDLAGLSNQVENTKAELKEKARELEKCKAKNREIQDYVAKYEIQINELQQIQYNQEMEIRSLKLRAESAKHLESKCQKLSQKVVSLTNDIEHLSNVQEIVTGTQEDVDHMLRDMIGGFKGTESFEAANKLATYCSVIKRELKRAIHKSNSFKTETTELKKNLGFCTQNLKREKSNAMRLQERINDLEKDNAKLIAEKENKNPSKTTTTPRVSFASPIPGPSSAIHDDFAMTPISVNFNDNKKRKIDLVVIDKNIGKISGATFKSSAMAISLKRSSQSDTKDTILKVGYNGFGGHGRFIGNGKSAFKP